MEACDDSFLLSFIATSIAFFILGRYSAQIQDRIMALLTPKGGGNEEYANLNDNENPPAF